MNYDKKIIETDEFGKVRVILDKEGAIWYVARDLTEALGFQSSARYAVANYISKENKAVGVIPGKKDMQEWTIVNQAGFQELVDVKKELIKTLDVTIL